MRAGRRAQARWCSQQYGSRRKLHTKWKYSRQPTCEKVGRGVVGKYLLWTTATALQIPLHAKIMKSSDSTRNEWLETGSIHQCHSKRREDVYWGTVVDGLNDWKRSKTWEIWLLKVDFRQGSETVCSKCGQSSFQIKTFRYRKLIKKRIVKRESREGEWIRLSFKYTTKSTRSHLYKWKIYLAKNSTRSPCSEYFVNHRRSRKPNP